MKCKMTIMNYINGVIVGRADAYDAINRYISNDILEVTDVNCAFEKCFYLLLHYI